MEKSRKLKRIKIGLSVAAIVATLGVLFTNAADPNVVQTFANFCDICKLRYQDMISDIGLNQGKLGSYINGNKVRFEDITNSFRGPRTDAYSLQIAQQQAKIYLIATTPELNQYYLTPIMDAAREQLSRRGFLLRAKVDPMIIEIYGAEREAKLSAVGKSIDRNFKKYGATTIIDPITFGYRGSFASSAYNNMPKRKVLHLGLKAFLSMDQTLGKITDSDMSFYHETAHADTFWKIDNGIRDLNAGLVTREVAIKYIPLEPGIDVYAESFVFDEVHSWRLSMLQPDGFNAGSNALVHAMAAASIETKVSLYNGLSNGSTKTVATGLIGKQAGFDKYGPTYVNGKGTAVYNSTGFVVIADIEPGTLTTSQIKEHLRQSIAESMVAMEQVAKKVVTKYNEGKLGVGYYTDIQTEFQKHKANILSVIDVASPEIFGPKLSTPAPISEVSKSPVVAALESAFGTSGLPQKQAGFRLAVMAGKSMGGDLSQPNALQSGGTGGSANSAALSRLDHIENVHNHTITGERFTDAEIATMPKSEISRTYEKNLYRGARVANGAGVFLMSYAGIQALSNGATVADFGTWLGQSAIGMVKFAGIQTSLQVLAVAAAGSVAAFNPIGAAVIIGATLGEFANLTINTVWSAADQLYFLNWLSGPGRSLGPVFGSPLTRLFLAAGLYNPWGTEAQSIINGSAYFPVQLTPQAAARIISAPGATGSTPEGVVNAIIGGLGLSKIDTDPSSAVYVDYMTTTPYTGGVSNFSSVAASINPDTRVQIKLRFICSSWLFLQSNPTAADPNAANISACNNFASAATAYNQTVFDNSMVPVKFIYTAEVEPLAPYLSLNGVFTISSGSPSDRINSINSSGAMPAITVTDTHFALKSDTTTCSPFAAPSCGDSNSTVGVSNFKWKWGIASPPNGTSNVCGGSVGCAQPGLPYQAFSFTPGSSGGCSFDCSCVHWANLSSVWTSAAGSCDRAYNQGAWPGAPLSIERNSCGCLLVYSTPKPYQPKAYYANDIAASRNWIKTKYPTTPGSWTVSIGVVPFSTGALGPFESFNLGSSTAIFDAHTNSVWTEYGVFQNQVTPNNLFLDYGYMSVGLQSGMGSQVLAHQMGHLFGAVHERSSWTSNAFYGTSYTNLNNREAAAYSNASGKSIMNSSLSGTIVPQFSASIPVGSQATALGDYRNNNRNQIIRTMMFLTGNQTIERPTDIESFGAYGAQATLGAAPPPPPTIDFSGGVEPSYLIGQPVEIHFYTTGIAPIVTASCSIDGGAFFPCTTTNSLTISTSLSPGDHYVTVRITDSFGASTTLNTQSFYIDPSPVITIINAILLDE